MRDTSQVLTGDAAQAAAQQEGGSGANASVATAAYDWRTDGTLISLAEAPDLDYQFSTSTVLLAWEPFEDVGSGIAKVAYCLGTQQFSCDVVDWITAPAVKSSVDHAEVSGLNLTSGVVYYGTIAAINHVGLVSMTSSDGVYVEGRSPRLLRIYDTGKYFLFPDAALGAGTVLYRPPVDINCDEEGGGVGASWRDVEAYAGIRYYEWAVGTAQNGTDILPWTRVDDATAVYNNSLFVPAGVTYFTSVRATAVNGQVAYSSSDGVRVLNSVDAAARMVCLPPLSRPEAAAGQVNFTDTQQSSTRGGKAVTITILSGAAA